MLGFPRVRRTDKLDMNGVSALSSKPRPVICFLSGSILFGFFGALLRSSTWLKIGTRNGLAAGMCFDRVARSVVALEPDQTYCAHLRHRLSAMGRAASAEGDFYSN